VSLRIYPAVTPYDGVYQTLLDNVLAGSQWLRSPVILPYLREATPFIIETTAGEVIDIYINSKHVKTITASYNSNQVDIQLEQGYNFIQVTTTSENYLILVSVTYWATFLYAWAREYYYHAGVRLEDAELQLTNFFSLRSVEHQIKFQDLLPPTRAERILTGKLAVKALINETGTTRGVNEITTAASNKTPVVKATEVNTEFLDPAYDLYTQAHDFGGYEFNCWLPNVCASVWAAFLTIINNASNIDVVSASDIQIVLNVGTTTAQITSSGFTNPTTFTGGETLEIEVDDIPVSVLFKAADQTQADVVARINMYTKLANIQQDVAWSLGDEIKLSSGKKGIISNISVTGGTGAATLGLSIQEETGTDGIQESHVFDFETDACNIIDTIFTSCFNNIRLWISADVQGDIAFCLWQHPLEKRVEIYLNAGLLDLGNTFDSGGTFDSGDPSDPYGDGFIGAILTSELDTGLTFDPFFDVTLYEDLACLSTGPITTILHADLSELQLDYNNILVNATMQITT